MGINQMGCYGLLHQNLNSCGWLLEIDIFSVMVKRGGRVG